VSILNRVTWDRGRNRLAESVVKPILFTGMLLGRADSLLCSLLVLVTEFRNGKRNWLRAERGNPPDDRCGRKSKLSFVSSEEDSFENY